MSGNSKISFAWMDTYYVITWLPINFPLVIYYNYFELRIMVYCTPGHNINLLISSNVQLCYWSNKLDNWLYMKWRNIEELIYKSQLYNFNFMVSQHRSLFHLKATLNLTIDGMKPTNLSYWICVYLYFIS